MLQYFFKRNSLVSTDIWYRRNSSFKLYRMKQKSFLFSYERQKTTTITTITTIILTREYFLLCKDARVNQKKKKKENRPFRLLFLRTISFS